MSAITSASVFIQTNRVCQAEQASVDALIDKAPWQFIVKRYGTYFSPGHPPDRSSLLFISDLSIN